MSTCRSFYLSYPVTTLVVANVSKMTTNITKVTANITRATTNTTKMAQKTETAALAAAAVHILVGSAALAAVAGEKFGQGEGHLQGLDSKARIYLTSSTLDAQVSKALR